ncbi:AP-1 complex subunit gamma-2-like [Gossypium australe]|uniref:AP-1 complex subunit gamma-2-like n=1 Tax=Gossypium australe TaxID=47621 RepID=A0A5B6WLL8_9ROSI|nr:AP-1 complex subunit gamma-2-like [Gossypium australe]
MGFQLRNFEQQAPIRLCRTGPLLSYFFSADDLILFGQVEEYQTRVIKGILDKFCEFSGH